MSTGETRLVQPERAMAWTSSLMFWQAVLFDVPQVTGASNTAFVVTHNDCLAAWRKFRTFHCVCRCMYQHWHLFVPQVFVSMLYCQHPMVHRVVSRCLVCFVLTRWIAFLTLQFLLQCLDAGWFYYSIRGLETLIDKSEPAIPAWFSALRRMIRSSTRLLSWRMKQHESVDFMSVAIPIVV